MTWRDGLQNVGFTLGHALTGFFLFGVLSVLLAHLFLLTLAVLAIRKSIVLSPPTLGMAAVLFISLVCLWIPYGGWIRASATLLAPRPETTRTFLYYAVIDGDAELAQKMLAKGLIAPTDLAPYLNAACVGKDTAVAKVLTEHGADIRAASECDFVPEISGKQRVRVPTAEVEVRP
jgi:hypothetical protein